MRFILAVLMLFAAASAHAATYEFEMRFAGDSVAELQTGFDRSANCRYGAECYPDDFRLASGWFADLEPGQIVSGVVDTDTGTARIGDWQVMGTLVPSSLSGPVFLSQAPTGTTRFTDTGVTLDFEGTTGYSPSGYCDPFRPLTGLPTGYCGYFGYRASFDVLGVTQVPVPASALLLLGGLLLLGTRRLARRA